VHTAQVGRAGNVQVRPLEALRELRKVRSCGDRPAFAAANVGKIRKVALQLFCVVLREGQLPGAIIRTQTCGSRARARAHRRYS